MSLDVTQLPPVDTDSWESFQSAKFTEDTDQRIANIPLAVNPPRDDWQAPGAFAPTSSDSLTNPLGTAGMTPPVAPAAEVMPQPEPAPAPADPFLEQADARIGELEPSPPPPPSTPAAPSGASGFTGPPDLIGAALNAASEAGLDPKLFLSLIQQESSWNPNARSPAGAQGLSQLMPATAAGLGVTDPNDPIENLKGGARYLKQQMETFGGDVTKALAAYNAGPGAVTKYGGVPPYEETQRYVSTILGRVAAEATDTSAQTGVEGSWAPGPTEGLRRVGSNLENQQGQGDISQFGDSQLTSDEAYAACGPAAAVRFAQRFGRNPSLREATDLAKTVGWTSAQGMAGLQSEKSLMDKLEIPTKLVSGAQWDVFSAEAQTGNPVTISTRGHYFTADGFNPETGAFHVGRSGLDLKGGKEWMTPGQMTAIMGPVQGALLADNPQVPTPSTADMDTDPLGWLSRSRDAIASSIGGAADAVGTTVNDAGQAARGALDTFTGPQPMAASQQPTPSDTLTNPLQQANPSTPAAGTLAAPAPQPTVFDAVAPTAQQWSREGLQRIEDAPPLDWSKPIVPQLGFDPYGAIVEKGVPQMVQGIQTGNLGMEGVLGGALETLGGVASMLPGTGEAGAVSDVARAAREAAGGARSLATSPEVAAALRARQRGEILPEFASGGLSKLLPGATEDAAVAVKTGARLSDEEALTLYDNLGQQHQLLDDSAAGFEAKAAEAFNPGLKARYQNEADKLRLQQTAIQNQADYLMEHGSLPPEVGLGALPDQAPAPAPEFLSPSRGTPARETGHLFGELTAGTKAARLPGAELPAGAKPIGLTTAEEVKRLRLQQWPEELRDTIQQGAEARDFGRTQRRGVISDDVSEKMADDLGRTFDDWVKGGKAGKAYNAEELRALRNAVGAQASTVRQLSVEVTAAKASGNLTDNLLVRQFAEGQKLQALTQVVEGATAEWGRAGRAFQGAARLVDLPPDEATARIYKLVGGRDNALQALDEYQKLLDTGAGVVAQAKFWAGVKHPPAGVEDWFRLLRYNSMLSGPRTFEVNVIGNSLELPWRLARDTVASTLRGNPRELAPEISGLMAGFAKGRTKFLEVMSEGVTTESALAGDLPRNVSDRVKNPVGKATARVLEVPGRIMGGMDEWAHAMANEMALGRRAGVQATRDGLKGKAWDARVAELLADPTAGMRKEAAAVADRMVYHGDMGTLGRALEQVQKVPYLGAILLPFLRTVYHISARGIDRSPLGLAGTIADVSRGVYGPRNLRSLSRALSGDTLNELPKGVVPLGERVGDNLAGTAAWTGFYFKAMEGNVSGAGPDDPEKRDMLRAQGWQAYSVKIGDHWVSYANWGPVAVTLASAAGAAEAQTYRKPGADYGALITDGLRRTSQLATEQSYLSGIGAVWKGLSEPDRYGSQFVGQFMTSLIPYGSALNTVGQATDPTMRTPGRENFGDFVSQSTAARLPGLRQGVPAAQDQLGRPVPNEASGAGALNPLRTTTIRSNAVLREMLANGADVGDPPKTFRSVPLTQSEQRELNAASGAYIEEAVTTLMRDPAYRGFQPEVKQQALQRAVAAARARAGGELMQRLGSSEASRRVSEERGKKVPVPIGQ